MALAVDGGATKSPVTESPKDTASSASNQEAFGKAQKVAAADKQAEAGTGGTNAAQQAGNAAKPDEKQNELAKQKGAFEARTASNVTQLEADRDAFIRAHAEGK